jgi:hypothetical protein
MTEHRKNAADCVHVPGCVDQGRQDVFGS